VDSVTGLVVARALIGAGVAVCLMGPLKAFATWYPRERQASLGAWIMTAGSLGALAAATPTELALRFVHWRTLFVVLAAVTFAAAVWIWLTVPDPPKPVGGPGVKAQWAGVRKVFAHPRFWWIAPLGGIGMGAFFALQGLWSVPWLIEVNGYDRAVAAQPAGDGRRDARGISGARHVRHATRAAWPASAAPVRSRFRRERTGARRGSRGLPGTHVWWSLYGLSAATISSPSPC
jgi:hypothetical protein